MYTSFSTAADAAADGSGEGAIVTVTAAAVDVERDGLVAGAVDGSSPVASDGAVDTASPIAGDDPHDGIENGDDRPSSPIATLDGTEIFGRSVPGEAAPETSGADDDAPRSNGAAEARSPLPSATSVAGVLDDELGGRRTVAAEGSGARCLDPSPVAIGVTRFFDDEDAACEADPDEAGEAVSPESCPDAAQERAVSDAPFVVLGGTAFGAAVEADFPGTGAGRVPGGDGTRHEGGGRARASVAPRAGNRTRDDLSARAADAVRVRALDPVRRPIRSRRRFGWWFRQPRKPRR